LPAAAYAVPFALNMAARGGSPMRTMDPARPPRKNIRRESGIFMSLIQRFRYGHYKFPKAELRTPKALVRLLDGSLIPRLLRAPIGVPEQLFDNALVADGLSRQALSQLARSAKLRVFQTGRGADSLNIQLVTGGFGLLAA